MNFIFYSLIYNDFYEANNIGPTTIEKLQKISFYFAKIYFINFQNN